MSRGNAVRGLAGSRMAYPTRRGFAFGISFRWRFVGRVSRRALNRNGCGGRVLCV